MKKDNEIKSDNRNTNNEQMIFRRHELKYMLSESQYRHILAAMRGRMQEDRHGQTTNFSLYYDTPDYFYARHSMGGPVYKEKLRVRSYGVAAPSTPVFVELKKKYCGVTYKRRITMRERESSSFIASGFCRERSQISREINYLRNLHPDLQPSVLISYERRAFYDMSDHDFRVTFDRNILWRTNELNLHTGAFGAPLLQDGQILMEVKSGSAIPMWFVDILSSDHIYRISFSKYGNACRRIHERKQL